MGRKRRCIYAYDVVIPRQDIYHIIHVYTVRLWQIYIVLYVRIYCVHILYISVQCWYILCSICIVCAFCEHIYMYIHIIWYNERVQLSYIALAKCIVCAKYFSFIDDRIEMLARSNNNIFRTRTILSNRQHPHPRSPPTHPRPVRAVLHVAVSSSSRHNIRCTYYYKYTSEYCACVCTVAAFACN